MERVVCLLFFLHLTCFLPVLGQPGFISIDCGKPAGYSYTDSSTGIHYTSDSPFIETGENYNVSSEFQNTADYLQANDLRSFPNGTRNCYTLKPVVKGKRYLLRAFFMYGNYDKKSSWPQFDLYLGTNLWYHVKIFKASVNYYTEIIAVSPASSMSVCLLNTNLGVPFLSALELRPLNDSIYKEANTSQSLVLHSTFDCGSTVTNKIRYQTDIYDRIWVPYSTTVWSNLNTSRTVDIDNGYQPSAEVMQTAFTSKVNSCLTFAWGDFSWTFNALDPNSRHYYFLHFAELQLINATQSRISNIQLNKRVVHSNISPQYLLTTTISIITDDSEQKPEISVCMDNSSTLPPIINALEIYSVKQLTDPTTHGEDVDAIMEIKSFYGIQRNWMGDPCSPSNLIWEGLKCSYDIPKQPRIIALDLSFSGLTGDICAYFSNLTELQYLDLMGNNLHGQIPIALQKRAADGSLNLRFQTEQKRARTRNVKIIISTLVCVIISILSLGIVIVWRWRWRKNQGVRTMDMSLRDYLPPFSIESRKFSYSELIRITDKFERVIGKGGFGMVYHGVLKNGTSVAVKVLSQSSSQGTREFQNEAQLLAKIHHKNLVPLVGYCNETNHLALIYEYMEEGSLASHLSGKASTNCTISTLSWRDRLQIAIQAAQGLEYLHKGCKPAIIHRDVKTSNILLDQNMMARISDFGLSKTFEEEGLTHVSTVVMGTPGYLDPEYYLTNKLNEKSDVYSFGVVLLELVTGQTAIIKTPEKIHILHWVQPALDKGDITDIADPRFQGDYEIDSVHKSVDLALECTQSVSFKRPTISEVLISLRGYFELETASERSENSRKAISSNTYSTIEMSSVGSCEITSLPTGR